MSDTLILGNAAPPIEPVAAELSTLGWSELAQGVYWHRNTDAHTCAHAAPATIDIVGVADANALEAQFLLLP